MNNNLKTIVSGTFKSEKDLSIAIQWLDEKGVAKEDINILISDKSPDKDFKVKTTNKVPEIAVRGLTIPKYEAIFFDESPTKSILLVTKADKAMKSVIKRKFIGIGATNIATQ